MKSLKRSELYERIWTTPISKLSKEFGFSDVGLAKVCKKYEIPRPPRGYWARVAHGYKDPKTPLPKAADIQIGFDVEANQRNRDRIQKEKEVEQRQMEAIKPVIERAENITHALAERFRARIEKVKPDSKGMLHMKRVGLPEVEIAVASVDRVLRFLSIVAYALTEKGITFGRDIENDRLLFERDGFGIGFKITQALKKEEREPTLEEKRNPSWSWDLTVYKPIDKLTIVLHSHSRIYGKKKWTESNANSITDLAPKVAARIDTLLLDYEAERLAVIEREKCREKQKVIDEKNRRVRERLDHIKKIKAGRARELIRASMLWQEHQQVTEFIETCERQWAADLTPEQQAWLGWAREIAEGLNPLNQGYPDPDEHGPFDEATIEEDTYYREEARFVKKTQMMKDIKKLTEKRGYGYSSW